MTIYIARNGEKIGPLSLSQAQQMAASDAVSPNDLAWYEGLPSWIPLSQVPGFAGGAAGVPGALPSQERPVLVWVISLFYFICTPISGISILFMPALLQMPQVQDSLQESQREYFNSLGLFNYYLPAIVGSVLSLAFAIQLFRLKRNSIYLIGAILVFGILSQIYKLCAEPHYAEVVGVTGLFSLVLTYGLLGALAFYTWLLIQKGTLR